MLKKLKQEVKLEEKSRMRKIAKDDARKKQTSPTSARAEKISSDKSHLDRMRRKADRNSKVDQSTSLSGEIVAASAPPSCKKCKFYHPGFKYRKCLFSECHYRKEIQVFRRKPLRRDRFS